MWIALAMLAAATAPECSVRGHTEPYAAVTLLPLNLGVVSPANGAAADAAGRFCIGAAPDGFYRLRAVKKTHASPASPGCGDCCAPSVEFAPAITEASIQIRGGHGPTMPVEILLRRVPAFCIRGTVTAKDVTVGIEAHGWGTSGVTDSDGRFLFTHLPPGRYTIVVWRRTLGRPDPSAVLARRVVEVTTRHVTGVAIRIRP